MLAVFCALAASPDAAEEEPQDPRHERTGTNGPDDLPGTDGNDLLNGKKGKDVLRGLGGNDILRGGRGDDKLLGGRGNDKLHGGRGDDTLTGGSGADRFVFSRRKPGDDIITDFEAGDAIVLVKDPKADPWPSVADILASVVEQDDRYTYTLFPGLTVQTSTALRAEDFVFSTSAPSLAAVTAHGVASAIASLEKHALGTPYLSFTIQDRTLTVGVPYHTLPISLHRPSKGILGGALDNDEDPSNGTAFVDADAPPAISGWTGSAKEWSRTDGAGVTLTDTVALYSKASSGETYLSFGWWARVPDSGAVGLGTFGNDPILSTATVGRRNSNGLNAAWPRGANAFVAGRHKWWPGFDQLDALSGAATYVGAAAGLWSERAAGERDGASGAFTADAVLTADFDHDTQYVALSGSIDNFRDASGTPLGSWTATLANESGGQFGGNLHGGGMGYNGNTAGDADGRNWTGGWVAQFFRRAATDAQSAHPAAVGGVFQAHHGTPAMAASNDQGFVGVVGAFGAEKQ